MGPRGPPGPPGKNGDDVSPYWISILLKSATVYSLSLLSKVNSFSDFLKTNINFYSVDIQENLFGRDFNITPHIL